MRIGNGNAACSTCPPRLASTLDGLRAIRTSYTRVEKRARTAVVDLREPLVKKASSPSARKLFILLDWCRLLKLVRKVQLLDHGIVSIRRIAHVESRTGLDC